MEWLQSIYDNAMSNMDRQTAGFSDSESNWAYVVAILAAVVFGIGINRFLKNRRGNDQDQDGGR